MLLFILGRQPEIGLAELRAVSSNQAELIAPEIAMIDRGLDWDSMDDFQKKTARRQFARLGSTVKVAEVFGEIPYLSRASLTEALHQKFSNVDGKITLGISLYGEKFSTRDSAKVGLGIKNILRTKNSVRLIPSAEKALNSAAVFHNKLDGDNIKKSELIIVSSNGKIFVARTIFVQNINSYTLRDRGRPKRDARVGMLPPKLAQTMINLATKPAILNDLSIVNHHLDDSHTSRAPVLLDPFCGTGVVLQESALMGFNVYGTDIEPRMIDYSEQNLMWLEQKYRDDFNWKLEVGDATNHTWQIPIDFVVTETYLGRPYATIPDEANLRENIANCEIILSKFLKNLRNQVSDKTGVCIAVPCWFVRDRIIYLKLIQSLAEIGFEQIFYSSDKKSLIYHRENQIVGRELLVLRKKS